VDRAAAAMERIISASRRFFAACDEIDRLMTGLTVARVMLQIETAKLRAGMGGLNEAIAQLDSAERVVGAHMRSVRKANHVLKRGVALGSRADSRLSETREEDGDGQERRRQPRGGDEHGPSEDVAGQTTDRAPSRPRSQAA
jgi:hypothetical protein